MGIISFHIWLICTLPLHLCWCQGIDTGTSGIGGESCQIVNVNFGDKQRTVANRQLLAGPPGKRGPTGSDGPRGPKGSMGPKGERGSSLKMSDVTANVMDMLNARSCSELQGFVENSGYYLMRRPGLAPNKAAYVYCDFRKYGAGTCAEAVKKYKITEYGYYLLSTGQGHEFHYCPDVYTCQQLTERDGVTQSGLYTLGPPGQTFEVYCNFFSGQAVTEVHHNFMRELPVESTCAGRGCYTATPKYQVSRSNMLEIIENSRECRQYIKMRCQGSALYFKTDPHAWWVSRSGEKMLYWGGAVSKRQHYCACGETESCIDNQYKCNCDNNKPSVMTQDEGYLTDKNTLPVKEVKFGDVDGAKEFAWHELGPLECTGREQH